MQVSSSNGRPFACLFALTAAALAISCLAGCEQTRPIPRYDPGLMLAANQVQTEATGPYRPSWAPSMKAPPRAGGGG